MKRFYPIFVVSIFIFPLVSFAAFDRDLFNGMKGGADITELQEFLTSENVYSGPVTGNFFNLTQDAVKKFQEREGIIPARGYFGALTRARANIIAVSRSGIPGASSNASLIQYLQSRIAALQAQLEVLQVQAKEIPLVQASTSPAVIATTSEIIVTPPPPAVEFRIAGSGVMPFPYAVVTPLKIGDITLSNRMASDVLINQIMFDLSDAMNSPNNRNRQVFFVLRDGPGGDIVSRTAFTFHSKPPYANDGTLNSALLNLSYPVLIKVGSEKVVGFSIENLELVLSGKLKFDLNMISATTALTPVGTVSFTFGQ